MNPKVNTVGGCDRPVLTMSIPPLRMAAQNCKLYDDKNRAVLRNPPARCWLINKNLIQLSFTRSSNSDSTTSEILHSYVGGDGRYKMYFRTTVPQKPHDRQSAVAIVSHPTYSTGGWSNRAVLGDSGDFKCSIYCCLVGEIWMRMPICRNRCPLISVVGKRAFILWAHAGYGGK